LEKHNNGYITPITLADSAYEKIRKAIVTGELKSGEKLSEPELCKVYGISRSPIRGALNRLRMEGLIISETNKSAYVWNPNLKDIEEILSLRCNFESFASEIIIDQISDEECSEMIEVIKKQEIANATSDFFRLIALDREFHYFIISKSKHTRVIRFWEMIMSQWEVLMHKRFSSRKGLAYTVLTDHYHIVSALKNKNIIQLLKLHIEINKRVTKELIEELGKV